MPKLIKTMRGTPQELAARAKIVELFKSSPIPDDEILIHLGLYLRSTILAKILYLNELYTLILDIPGVIMEFGTWWGANITLFNNLRNVHEPYNWTRQVIGFDTFSGYPPPTESNGNAPSVVTGNYGLPDNYIQYITELLDAHEQDNIMPHIKKYQLVTGDAGETITQYLHDNPQTIIALAYFDMQLYAPTRQCLMAIQPHLVRGSIIAMDELNSAEFPGETIAFKETIGLSNHKIVKSKFLSDRSYIIYKE